MHVESRLRSTRLGDAPVHVARFLVLWLVIAVSVTVGLYALMGIMGLPEFGDHFVSEFISMLIFNGLGGWLPALLLTIAWRSSEVAHG